MSSVQTWYYPGLAPCHIQETPQDLNRTAKHWWQLVPVVARYHCGPGGAKWVCRRPVLCGAVRCCAVLCSGVPCLSLLVVGRWFNSVDNVEDGEDEQEGERGVYRTLLHRRKELLSGLSTALPAFSPSSFLLSQSGFE